MYDSDTNGVESEESEGRDDDTNEDDDGNNLEEQSYEQDLCGEGEMGCITVESLQDILRIDLKNLCVLDMSMYEFSTADVAYLFYKWYGRVNEFAVRKNNIVRDKTEEVIQRRYVCSRQGICRDNDNRVRQVRPETRCWCLAEFVIHVDRSNGRWRVKRFVDSHNHDLLPDEYTAMIASNRCMGEADILQMNNMRKSGLRGTDIFKSFAGQSGGFYNMGYSLKDMQNQISRQRRGEQSDATAAIEYLRGLEKHDSLIYCREKVSEEGRLELLFWSDGISQISYQVFDDVLAFDATYSKNKYKCLFVVFCGINHHNKTTIFASALVTNETEETYVWLLDNFLRAMKGKAPSSIITDGCPAMRNAIKKVFPKAHHRLCAWHLQKGASKHVQITYFTRQLSKCMYFELEVAEFENLWAEVVTQHGLEGNEWVTDLYEKKKMWAAAHIRGHFFAGLRTTSRCEGMNSQIGRFVNSGNTFLEFVQHFNRLLNYMRFKEVELDFKSAYGDAKLETPLRSLERSASKVFTLNTFFLLIKPVLARAGAVRVISCNETFTCDIYTVSNCGVAQKQWYVSHYEPASKFSCSCLRMESFGLPCTHLIAVLAHLNTPKALLESLSHSARYQIFLSFRGVDTRYSFTGSLYDALSQEGFKTFMDDGELEGGDQISQTLINAIEASKLSIIVLSENYAKYAWCLDELVKILECMKTKNQLVWPIFYKVEPSDVRSQKNSYGKAMVAHENRFLRWSFPKILEYMKTKIPLVWSTFYKVEPSDVTYQQNNYVEAMVAHENRFVNDSEKIQRWRSALSEVAGLSGMTYSHGYEYKFIQTIVEKAKNNKNRLYLQSTYME